MQIRKQLKSLALEYPPELVAGQLQDIDRIAFHIELALSFKGTQVTVCDLGGGIGLFSVGCAAIGMRSVLVDDFSDGVNQRLGEKALVIHRQKGVDVRVMDLVQEQLPFAPGSLDIVTCFDSIEHWHNSPKSVFTSVIEMLVPGGHFLLSAPNCVNLRKRISCLFGRAKWSSMADWYETARFRGHVREPDIADLRYIGRDLGLMDIQIFGRNWMGYSSENPWRRWATRLIDPVLRLRPSLCSNIYLLGTKSFTQ